MRCYFRHLPQIFKKAGIEVTSKNRRDVDRIIHRIVDPAHRNCPATWREVRKRIEKTKIPFTT